MQSFSPERKKQLRIGALVSVVLVVLIYIFGIRRAKKYFPREPPFDPLAHCTTPFATLLGYADDVPAFSNCHRRLEMSVQAVVPFEHPLDVREYPAPPNGRKYQTTGTTWLSTEYVDRFTFHHRGMHVYYNEDAKPAMWGAIYFNMLYARRYETIEIPNDTPAETKKNRKRSTPKRLDLVIWAPVPKDNLRKGHIAVVVDVKDDVEAAGGDDKLRELREQSLQPLRVYIAEQNFDNKHWGGNNYSRVLQFSWVDGKKGKLVDSTGYVIEGWVRPGKKITEREKRDDL